MPKLPAVTGPEAIRAIAKVGFVLDRIRGSHHILRRPGHPRILAVPVPGSQPIPSGTLRGLIRAAGLSVAEFIALLD